MRFCKCTSLVHWSLRVDISGKFQPHMLYNIFTCEIEYMATFNQGEQNSKIIISEKFCYMVYPLTIIFQRFSENLFYRITYATKLCIKLFLID